jgi:hypothetical protein
MNIDVNMDMDMEMDIETDIDIGGMNVDMDLETDMDPTWTRKQHRQGNGHAYRHRQGEVLYMDMINLDGQGHVSTYL